MAFKQAAGISRVGRVSGGMALLLCMQVVHRGCGPVGTTEWCYSASLLFNSPSCITEFNSRAAVRQHLLTSSESAAQSAAGLFSAVLSGRWSTESLTAKPSCGQVTNLRTHWTTAPAFLPRMALLSPTLQKTDGGSRRELDCMSAF